MKKFELELRSITETLDPFWKVIRDDFPDSHKSAVAELGDAIVSLNKIRERIYEFKPELKPDN